MFGGYVIYIFCFLFGNRFIHSPQAMLFAFLCQATFESKTLTPTFFCQITDFGLLVTGNWHSPNHMELLSQLINQILPLSPDLCYFNYFRRRLYRK